MTIAKVLLLGAVVAVISSGPRALAAEYFMDPAGSDGNSGNSNTLRNCEVDGTGTKIQIAVGSMGSDKVITHNYAHDLMADTGDTGNPNSSGGAEGFVIFGGKNVEVAYNVAVDSKWLYLLQILNTHLDNVVFEHNTIIHAERNEQIWSKDRLSHQDMLGMFFYADPYTGSWISDQVKPTDLIVRDNIFIEPFSKRREGLWIGGGFAHYNNIFSPSTIPLGGYELDPTEFKVDNVGLIAGFRPDSNSPAIDKASSNTTYAVDVDGHKVPSGATADIGASEYCADCPFKTRWLGGVFSSGDKEAGGNQPKGGAISASTGGSK